MRVPIAVTSDLMLSLKRQPAPTSVIAIETMPIQSRTENLTGKSPPLDSRESLVVTDWLPFQIHGAR